MLFRVIFYITFFFIPCIFIFSLNAYSADIPNLSKEERSSNNIVINYYDIRYSYAGDYAYIIGEIENVTNENYEDIMLKIVSYKDNDNFISEYSDEIYVPYILPEGKAYFKKILPRNIGISKNEIFIEKYIESNINYQNIHDRIDVIGVKQYQYQSKFRRYFAIEGYLKNNNPFDIDYLKLHVAFFDCNKKVIDLGQIFIDRIESNEEITFKISSAYVQEISSYVYQLFFK